MTTPIPSILRNWKVFLSYYVRTVLRCRSRRLDKLRQTFCGAQCALDFGLVPLGSGRLCVWCQIIGRRLSELIESSNSDFVGINGAEFLEGLEVQKYEQTPIQ